MDKDERDVVIGTVLVVGFIMIMVIAIVAGCIGGCHICESTKRKYIERGYVEQWSGSEARMPGMNEHLQFTKVYQDCKFNIIDGENNK